MHTFLLSVCVLVYSSNPLIHNCSKLLHYTSIIIGLVIIKLIAKE